MRAAAGFAAVPLVFATAGMALFYALGFVTRLRQLPAAIGPAYFCGLAAVLPILILMLVAGLPVRLPEFVGVSLGLAAVLGALGVRASRSDPGRADPAGPAAPGFEAWVTRLLAAALGVFFLVGATAFVNLPTVSDDAGIWSYKGLILFEFGELEAGQFDGKEPGPAVPGHPILLPVLESLFFRAMAGPFLQEWHVVLWLTFGAFVWTAAWLVRARGAGLLALVPLAVLAFTPQSRSLISAGYADATVAGFLAAGALSIGLWLDNGRARYAVLGGILLAAAANTKNEGAVAAVAIVLVAAGGMRFARLRQWRTLGATAAIAVGGFAAWSWWRSRHELENPDLTPLGDALDWGFLTGRLDELSEANGRLFLVLADQGLWLWIVPCFLALALACLVRGTARRIAGYYLAVATLMLLSLLWVYWTAANDSLLRFSADRVTAGVVFVCAMGLIHVLAALFSQPRVEPGPG